MVFGPVLVDQEHQGVVDFEFSEELHSMVGMGEESDPGYVLSYHLDLEHLRLKKLVKLGVVVKVIVVAAVGAEP